MQATPKSLKAARISQEEVEICGRSPGSKRRFYSEALEGSNRVMPAVWTKRKQRTRDKSKVLAKKMRGLKIVKMSKKAKGKKYNIKWY